MSVIRSSAEPSEVFRGGRAVEQIMRGERELWSAESWPVSGTWSTNESSPITRQVAEYTVPEDGLYTIAWTVTDSEFAVAYINTPSGNSGTVTGTNGQPAEVVAEQSLLAGDTIAFHAANRSAVASGRWEVARVGDWITKIEQMRPDFLLTFQNALTEQSGTQSSTLVSTTGGEVKWNFASAEDPNNFYGTYGGKQEWSPGRWSKGAGFGSSIGAWIKCPASNAGGRDAIHWRSSDGRWEMYVSCDTNQGKFYGGALINGQWRGLPVAGGNFRGKWAHVALTYLNGQLMLYVNGAYVSSVGIPDSTVAVPNSPVWVGAGKGTQPWNVILDDVFVFSRSLTVTEIAAIAAAPRTKPQQ